MHLVRVDLILSISVILSVLGLDPPKSNWDATGSDIEWEQALSNSRVAAQSFASTVGRTKRNDWDLESTLLHPKGNESVGNVFAPGQRLESSVTVHSVNLKAGINGNDLEQAALKFSISNEESLQQNANENSGLTVAAKEAPSTIVPTYNKDQGATRTNVQVQSATLPGQRTVISNTFKQIEGILEQSHRETSIESQPIPPSSGSIAVDAPTSAYDAPSAPQLTEDAVRNSNNPYQSAASDPSIQSGMTKDFPWYHSGESIHAALADLTANCDKANLALTSLGGESVSLDVVRVTKGSSKGKKKALFVFGEHAREVVSPESGLHFLLTLCGKTATSDQELLDRVLATTDFVIVPNANPMGRKQVEAGNYCKRTNENGVDLNRNWGDEHRETMTDALKMDEKNPGPRGFSEPETQILKDLVTQETPDIYLSVHSGAYLLGTPFGYTELRQADNQKDMLDVLQPISQKVCNGECPFGDMAHLIGYNAGGCDIDYIKETLGTPYVFTWEIYAGGGIHKYFSEEAHSRAEHREMSEEALRFFDRNGQGFLQRSHKALRSQTILQGKTTEIKPESQQHPDACFRQFNPESQIETEELTQSWSEAYLMLCDGVAKHISKA